MSFTIHPRENVTPLHSAALRRSWSVWLWKFCDSKMATLPAVAVSRQPSCHGLFVKMMKNMAILCHLFAVELPMKNIEKIL